MARGGLSVRNSSSSFASEMTLRLPMLNGSHFYLQLETAETTGVDGPALDAAASRHKCFGNHERAGDNVAVDVMTNKIKQKFTLLRSLIISTIPITIYRNATF